MVAYLASTLWGQFLLGMLIVVTMGFAVKSSVSLFVREHSVNLSEILPDEDSALLIYKDEKGVTLFQKEVPLQNAITAVSMWNPSGPTTAFSVSAVKQGEALISSSLSYDSAPILEYSPEGLELALKFANKA